MGEEALDIHLQGQEQRPPERMVMVEKAYLEWAGQKITQLETVNAELLETLEDIHSALDMCGKGNSKAQLLNQVKYANGRAVKAIRKAEQRS